MRWLPGANIGLLTPYSYCHMVAAQVSASRRSSPTAVPCAGIRDEGAEAAGEVEEGELRSGCASAANVQASSDSLQGGSMHDIRLSSSMLLRPLFEAHLLWVWMFEPSVI